MPPMVPPREVREERGVAVGRLRAPIGPRCGGREEGMEEGGRYMGGKAGGG